MHDDINFKWEYFQKACKSFYLKYFMGRDSANAIPHYQKLCARVSLIWGNREGQPVRGAIYRPRLEGTTFVIMVPFTPGKYDT